MLAWLPLLLACADPPWSDTAPGFLEGPPEIEAVELTCDLELERWRLEVETRHWAGGGLLYWTRDFEYLERHPLRSVRAAPDGSTDLLRVDLAIVGDWREASPGGSTAMHCADDPSGLFLLHDLDGNEVACHRFGPEPERWGSTEELPACASDEWTD